MDKFGVYVEIRQLLKQGFSKAKMGKRLGISRLTLYRYLQKDPNEMADRIDSLQVRSKKLDPYKDKISSWLKENPDMPAAQVEDWLSSLILYKYKSLDAINRLISTHRRSAKKSHINNALS